MFRLFSEYVLVCFINKWVQKTLIAYIYHAFKTIYFSISYLILKVRRKTSLFKNRKKPYFLQLPKCHVQMLFIKLTAAKYILKQNSIVNIDRYFPHAQRLNTAILSSRHDDADLHFIFSLLNGFLCFSLHPLPCFNLFLQKSYFLPLPYSFHILRM